ncbi:MAG: hypothetical protein AVDCRST_MAG27-287 [uncultured Craurococcus sp.]|uniref:Uncharacterized protein n=1 Tax=uncultured Craurococcus sp. TaxID=1135998 RepID=A0A6J4HGS6_9PROT|nr:MAG: hypothetical protein AVDCRST_MAG27-287 [uncultured Craurococcus sp.]
MSRPDGELLAGLIAALRPVRRLRAPGSRAAVGRLAAAAGGAAAVCMEAGNPAREPRPATPVWRSPFARRSTRICFKAALPDTSPEQSP